MDILKWIDVALGVILVYLVFSLGVTAFNEAIATVYSSRAKWLRKGIAALLTPTRLAHPATAAGVMPTSAPTPSPVAASGAPAEPPTRDEGLAPALGFTASSPTALELATRAMQSLPPPTTQRALQATPPVAPGAGGIGHDLVAAVSLATSTIQSRVMPEPALAQSFFDSPFIAFLGTGSGLKRRFKPSYIAPWAMFQGLLDAAVDGRGGPLATIDAITRAADALPEGTPIRAAAHDLIAQAQGDVDRLRKLVDEWFQRFDDQVRSWYRQKTQYMLWSLSAMLVVAMNVDTLAILEKLSIDDKTRAAIVEQALKTAKDDKLGAIFETQRLTAARDDARNAFDAKAKATAALDDAKKANNGALIDARKADLDAAEKAAQAADARIATEQAKLQQTATDLMSGVSASGLPLGWSHVDTKAMSGWDVFVKALGLLLSAAALSLGAPFWFDMLKKIASIRSVGLDLVERKKKQAAANIT